MEQKKGKLKLSLTENKFTFAKSKKDSCLINHNKKMKKVALFFAVSAAFALASCGGNNANQNAENADSAAVVDQAVEAAVEVVDSAVAVAGDSVAAAADSAAAAVAE